jgi:hypothetical protein
MPALAETSGIRFDQMPVGCRIHGVHDTGEQEVDEYLGQRDNTHIIETRDGKKEQGLIRTTTYSAEGLMLRKDWANGDWETFAPAACLGVLGPCNYTYRNSNRVELTYEGQNYANGNKIIHEGGWQNSTPFSPVMITIGRFNMANTFVEGDTSFMVTRYENCGLGS